MSIYFFIFPLKYFYILGENALHNAAYGENLEIIKILINSGIPLHETNNKGKKKTRNIRDYLSIIIVSIYL